MMNKHVAIPLCLLVVLAGCTATPAPSTSKVGTTPATGTTTSTGSNIATGTGTGATGQVATNAGTTVNASGNIDVTVPGAAGSATGQPALSGAALQITAKSGGHYVSADGTLTADIPPGALSKDATVHITRNDTSGLKVSSAFVPGINFNVDLGGAQIAPGQSLTVTAKVDARFVDTMKQRDPAFTADKYNLKQDATGNWTMTMKVNGPQLTKTVTPASINLKSHLQEFGALPLPSQIGAPRQYRRIFDVDSTAAASPTPTSTPTASQSIIPGDVSTGSNCTTFDGTVQTPVPSSINSWYDNEGTGNFSCDVYDGVGWYMNIWTDLMGNRQACGAPDNGSTTGSSPAPEQLLQADTIPAHVTWLSDDPALNGKDAAGADVRFDLPWSPSNGPADVVCDAAGLAQSFTVDGLPVKLTANTQIGPASGDTVSTTAAANMANVELQCPKYSPKVTFHVEPVGSVTIPSAITVHYTIDGGADQTQIISGSEGSSVDLTAYIIMPDDNAHSIVVTSIDAGADLGMQAPAPDALSVQRNGQYTLSLKVANLAAH